MSHTAKTPPVAKGSNGLPVNAVDGTQAYDTDKDQYVVNVSNAWQGVGGGGGFGTPTVVYDDGAAVGNTDQIQGDIPANWKQNDNSLKGLVIGTSCTTIGDGAFQYCTSLTGTLTIPNSVTTIGDYAFRSCSGLTGSLTIPDSVTTIGEVAFANCTNLTGSLTIPNSVTSIGNAAFFGCTSLTGTLTIGNSVTTIGNLAFYGCSGLTGSLTIPNSVTTIGTYAFYNCSGLTGSLTLPTNPNLTTIGNLAFYGCSGLTGSLTIPNSVTTIGDSAFEFCSLTGNLDILDSVTSIGTFCFRGNDFTSVTIGSGLAAIPNGLLFLCASMTDTLVLPATVSSVGNNAFNGCAFDRIEYYITAPPPQSVAPFGGGNNATEIHVPAVSSWVASSTWNELTVVKDLV